MKHLGVWIFLSSIVLAIGISYRPEVVPKKPGVSEPDLSKSEQAGWQDQYVYQLGCDIYKGNDWCQKYIDYGYNNGLVMAGRELGENKFLHKLDGTPIETCEQVVQDMYDAGVSKVEPTFKTRQL